jgi:hypothetical protein
MDRERHGLARYGRITDDCREHIVGEVRTTGDAPAGGGEQWIPTSIPMP